MNTRLSDFGDFEKVSRSECLNDACKLCDQYFSHIDHRVRESEHSEETTNLSIDDDLMFLVEQSVINSLSQSNKTACITPAITSNEDYEDIYMDQVK